MRWTAEHDLTLLKEMLLQEPYKYKHGSPERGQVWDIMSQTLNYMEDLYFKVSQRSVRDRFKTISDNFKRRIREEESASGITPDYTELDQALHDVIERFKVADEDHKNLSASKKAKIDEEVEKASEMRKRSLETFKETNDRLENSDDGECGTKMTPKRNRNSGSETLQYLRSKSETESALRTQELQLKQQQQNTMLTMMNQMQQTQTQMLQQFSETMKQQKEQSIAMMQAQQSLLLKLLEKKD